MKIIRFFIFIFLCQSSISLAGGITVGGTRVIYNESKKEALLSVNNTDTAPYLIQSWVEMPEGQKGKPPFVITPPLFRLDGNSENILRIVNINGDLPKNEESLFWVNVKAIPSNGDRENKNTLQIAIRTKIKLIYRPESVKGSVGDQVKNLKWAQNGTKLSIVNPTPFIMNFQSIKVGSYTIDNPTFILPNSESSYELPNGVKGPVTVSVINDFGGVIEPLTLSK